MRLLFKIAIVALLLGLASCGKYRYTTTAYEMPFTEIDTLSILSHQRTKKPVGVVLFIGSYDSLYDISKTQIIGPLTKKKLKVIEIQKYAYDDFLLRSGTDEMGFYVDNISNGYQYYRALNPSDSALPFGILGINEGAVITPQLALSLRADEVAAVNPHFIKFELLLIELLANVDDSAVQQRLFNQFNVRSAEELYAWLHLLEISEPSDRTLAGKSTKYWKSWFAYDPGAYWPLIKQPIHLLFFEDYLFHTEANKQRIKEVRQQIELRNTQSEGSGFTRDDYKAIENWLLDLELFEAVQDTKKAAK